MAKNDYNVGTNFSFSKNLWEMYYENQTSNQTLNWNYTINIVCNFMSWRCILQLKSTAFMFTDVMILELQ